MKYSKKEILDSHDTLKKYLNPGDTVYLILRRVSRSGMSRDITPLIFKEGLRYQSPTRPAALNEYDEAKQVPFLWPIYLSYHINVISGKSQTNSSIGNSVRMTGYGMDTGFDLVSELSYALFNDVYALRHEWL